MKPPKSYTYFLLLLLFCACNSSGNKEKADNSTPFNPVGDWNYMVTTDVSRGTISITGTPGNYAASMTTEAFGVLVLHNLKIEGKSLQADLDVGGTAAAITCTFDGNNMTGTVSAGEDRYPFEGKRKTD